MAFGGLAKHQRNFKAAGRLKVGQMNKTEARYASYLNLLKHSGAILWYAFEGVKLRLADNTFLTVDFILLNADGLIELHDVKGSLRVWSEDSKVKMKVAAEMYPFIFKVVVPADSSGTRWTYHEI